MDIYSINDKRTTNEFRNISFSGFKKTKVKNELLNSLLQSRIEPSCYWCAELICAGHFIDIWNIIILFVSKHIHIGSPKLPVYISLRMNSFKQIMSEHYEEEIYLRNNDSIRNLFAEVMTIICYSRKKHAILLVDMKNKDEYSMHVMQTKLKAPDISYGTNVFKREDPPELFVAVNEFAYHLSKSSSNEYTACYWLEWLLNFDNLCKKNKQSCLVERRTWAKVDSKFQKDSIWLIWDIFLSRAEEKGCNVTIKIIRSLLDMFCLRYTTDVKRTRKFILYNCIGLLTEPVDLTIPIWNDQNIISDITNKINVIYKEIKLNQQEDKPNYLFQNVEKSNADKTKEKINIMNTVFKYE
uniref:Uncharacterized protein n=1 Tax=viral metagenome TaxID=1070528 RepID=A0A6C0JV61_9ZZZZ